MKTNWEVISFSFFAHYCLLRAVPIMAELWQSFPTAIIVVITAGGWPWPTHPGPRSILLTWPNGSQIWVHFSWVFLIADQAREERACQEGDQQHNPANRGKITSRPLGYEDLKNKIILWKKVSMTSDQFCLKWNNYQANIVCALGNLKLDEDFVDVTLSCEGRTIKAHKVILSACSAYFKNVFKVRKSFILTRKTTQIIFYISKTQSRNCHCNSSKLAPVIQ